MNLCNSIVCASLFTFTFSLQVDTFILSNFQVTCKWPIRIKMFARIVEITEERDVVDTFFSNITGDIQRIQSNKRGNTEQKRNKERRHKRTQCRKTSYQELHQRLETRKKQHECSQCFKTFESAASLAIHQRIHTGEKHHQCSTCGKAFNQLSNLKKHQRIHTGEKPHQCSQCGKAFSIIGYLKRHQTIHSSDVLP